MRECILAIFWPKRDIFNFLSNCGCTKDDLKTIEKFEEDQTLTRAKMVDEVFFRLTKRLDNGLGQFRSLLNSLISWTQFDSYYFDKLKKLDQKKAEYNIAHLKQLVEIRDEKLKKQREVREKAESERQKPRDDFENLKKTFYNLFLNSETPAKRGYLFQNILLELARNACFETTEPFVVNGEQIDGAFKFDGEHYIVEAKWQDKEASNESVYQFAGKIEGKMYGRGLFFSVNGFSEPVIKSLVLGKAIKTIFVDGEDLTLVFENMIDFRKMIDNKVKAAQTKGLIYVHPISLKNKIDNI